VDIWFKRRGVAPLRSEAMGKEAGVLRQVPHSKNEIHYRRREEARDEGIEKSEAIRMIRRLLCLILSHDTFSFPSGAVVCKRCFRWWV
jgi:hypothetical protein